MIRLPLVLSADNLNFVEWWVYASHTAHNDIRGHIRATMSMQLGLVLSMPKKQKLNMKRLTETKLIEAVDVLSHML